MSVKILKHTPFLQAVLDFQDIAARSEICQQWTNADAAELANFLHSKAGQKLTNLLVNTAQAGANRAVQMADSFEYAAGSAAGQHALVTRLLHTWTQQIWDNAHDEPEFQTGMMPTGAASLAEHYAP